ncbi:molybdopterin-dependent oxidoreductase [Streptomyces chartreusis]|uniref:molybdopterin-dependent oxidoreductase n=1 Tax=Streptomyces chartreusis TaxID=1969 RepID=UPI003D94F0E9
MENPVTLSYDHVKAMPKKEQITQHYCIQGWSGVAKWSGVPMREILALVKPMPEARWVIFWSGKGHGAARRAGSKCRPSFVTERTVNAA